jgi:hypothetical protein
MLMARRRALMVEPSFVGIDCTTVTSEHLVLKHRVDGMTAVCFGI